MSKPQGQDYRSAMSLDTVHCGPCMSTKTNQNASIWCIICEEGFCGDCKKVHTSSKISADHNVISIEDYKKIAHVTVGQTCKNHGKRLELFCKTHDEPLCVLCVPTTSHKTCSEIVGLDDVVKNAKRSAALADLEETIDRTLESLISNIKDRNSVLKDVSQQEQFIKVKINDIRTKLNKHLDKLEQKLVLELTKKSESCKSKTAKELSIFESLRNQLNQLKNETSQLKAFASDLQMFLGTRQINGVVNDHIQSAKKQINNAKNYNLEFKIDPTMNTLLDINDLGNIEKVESDANLIFKEAHIDQAQIPVTRVQTIHDTKSQLKHKFQIKQEGGGMLISGCVMLPNGHILISDYEGKKQLMEYNDKGEHTRDIPVSSKPFDLTLIDTERIAVSYGHSKYIEIINITSNVVEKKIKLGKNCWGISYQDAKLYTVVENKGIVIVDMTGKTINTIECGVSYLTTTKDRLYYTDWVNHIVHCCSMTGEHIWVFKDQSIVNPVGISVDNNQNVYVVGQMSDNLTLIQHDGTMSKTLLTQSDGLDFPSAVYYDKTMNLLFVIENNYNGQAAIYNVI